MAITAGAAISMGISAIGAMAKGGGGGGGGVAISPADPQELSLMQPVQREDTKAASVHTADVGDPELADLTSTLFEAWFSGDDDEDEEEPTKVSLTDVEGIDD